ncbi:RNA cytosine C(5)-methyltransferase NSUN2-like [Mercenaria mercenaria]|uniref:RNA cytosine C(5)-methyltransferase NSUN2-like n=1 Tax=Mercenaria mercenaria TaxID=6596 RepID=UPI00234E650C|nr:RNA cytosine C(5)-methyltransferase NSUN2-like [Mercenaria mercenaria]
MPQKPKKRPPPPANQIETVTMQNAETVMSTFIKYYKGIGLVPEEEWKHFFTSCFSDLPFTFRICENRRKINNILEGKPGTLGQAEVLREFLRNSIFPKVANVKVDDVPFEVTPLPWYPKQLAWRTNVDHKTFFQCDDLKPISNFITQEDKAGFVSKGEIANMIPPLLVDINPSHKILEMCAAPGYQTTQILEQILNSPKKLSDGFVVANDVDFRINYRWSQGTNVFFTHEDAKKFPDLYTTEEHVPESKILYDRIFIDAPSSDDGSLRSNKKVRAGWNVTKAQKNHKDLKAMLRRGLELLELNGQLVYITTSLNPIENEAVVAALLKEAPETLELVDVRNRLPDFHVRPGMAKWKVMSQGLVFYDTFESSPLWFQKENEDTLFAPTEDDAALLNLDRCLRVMPHDNDTGGFFVAVITKFGPLPWQKDEAEEAMETEADVKQEGKEDKVDGAGDAEKKKKSPYTLPIRVDVNVCCSEIEWTTEVTNESLNTTATTETSNFDLAPMKISKSCMPAWLQKKLQEQACRYEEVKPTDSEWVTYRDMFDLKKVNPLPNMLKYVQDGKFTLFYYYNPTVRSLIRFNTEVARRSKAQCGGMLMMRCADGGKTDVKSTLPVLQFMNKRLLTITRADLVQMLENKEVVIKDLTDRLQKELQTVPDNGPVYFLYEPKGKNADPKCAIVIWREKFPLFVKDEFFTRSERQHCLRLCGVDPDTVEAEEEEEAME